ncbi:MAG: diadenylate cyclase [Candidatus Thermoplasmatota archaeon]|nr:diadenylate cyclase [Candidatus Thermoplasmatota archaeon]
MKFIEHCLDLEEKASVVYLITDTSRVVEKLRKGDTPIIVATANKKLYDKMRRTGVKTKKLIYPMRPMDILTETKNQLLEAYAEGMIKSNDSVLCVIANKMNALIMFNPKDIGITQLKKEMKGRIRIIVAEAVLGLAFEIMKEGREGKSIGTLFIVGDTEKVMENSRQVIINPFKGHDEESRNILNRGSWETLKEFALLDGAFIVNRDGVVGSAGRYININWDITLQGGLGGRHLAAASVTRDTKAIAVVVSASRVIRIFKDGKIIFKIGG